MRPFLEQHFGNPSSAHRYGAVARAVVARARSQVANLLNASPHEIVFTSGGTESNNYAIRGAALGRAERGRHVITSQIEHPAVTEVCRQLEAEGFEITWLPVDGDAQVRVGDVEAAIRPDTVLITLMHANNEVGTIQPISAVADVARRRGILFHADAAQSVGKISTDVDERGAQVFYSLHCPCVLDVFGCIEGVLKKSVRSQLALDR